MSCPYSASRRGMLAAAGGLLAATTVRAAAQTASAADRTVQPFHGPHQAGIATPQQTHCYVMALDLVTPKRADVVAASRPPAAASMPRREAE
jgi:deferrochelatase/peroxidase EfeB